MTEVYKIGGGWGNSVQWDDHQKFGYTDEGDFVGEGSVYGFKRIRPTVGDLLECKMRSGKVGIFEFTSVKLLDDPSDMFFGDVKAVRYREENE